MSRVKRGVNHTKKRKKLLKLTKGYRLGRKNLVRRAKEAIKHAGVHAYVGRKDKKGDFRKIWTIKINAALRGLNEKYSYSKFIGNLKKNNIEIDRKVLADLAENNPEVFKNIVEKTMK
ncbi:50S ribosomal protein L20 [Patescibacteria group bacterium]|nr:50S ribosomal protein L20 [Patescibacteria group bacterium]